MIKTASVKRGKKAVDPKATHVHIGTSGYSYPYWKDRFYPEKLTRSKWLEYYASKFNTLELNYTFYRFPKVKVLANMASATPPGFQFSVKVHKIITHSMRMKNAEMKLKEFSDIVEEGLGNKFSCLLFQLPPSFSFSDERMDDILKSVWQEKRNIIEFRHESWWQGKVYRVLKKNNLTFCNSSFPGLPDTNVVTTDIFYKRMHGVPELFKSSYSSSDLSKLAKAIPRSKDCYVYFNNTMYEAGYENALELANQLMPVPNRRNKKSPQKM